MHLSLAEFFDFDNITDQLIFSSLSGIDLATIILLDLPSSNPGSPTLPDDYSASNYDLYFDNASISSNAIIPEPSTLLGSFLIGGLFWRKKKTKLG